MKQPDSYLRYPHPYPLWRRVNCKENMPNERAKLYVDVNQQGERIFSKCTQVCCSCVNRHSERTQEINICVETCTKFFILRVEQKHTHIKKLRLFTRVKRNRAGSSKKIPQLAAMNDYTVNSSDKKLHIACSNTQKKFTSLLKMSRLH